MLKKPGFLLESEKTGEIEGMLVVWKLDRLSRSRKDVLTLMEKN